MGRRLMRMQDSTICLTMQTQGTQYLGVTMVFIICTLQLLLGLLGMILVMVHLICGILINCTNKLTFYIGEFRATECADNNQPSVARKL